VIWAPVGVLVILVVVELERLVLHLEEFRCRLLDGRLTTLTGGWRRVKGGESKVEIFLLAGDLQDPLEVFHKFREGGTLVRVEVPTVAHQEVELHAALSRLLHPETRNISDEQFLGK